MGGFREVFAAVSAGRTTVDAAEPRVLAGVLPIENVLGGTVRETYDLLLEHDLGSWARSSCPVHLCLAALPGERLEAVERVYSHVQALAQAERFLRTRPWALLTTYNTAAAGRMVAERGGARLGRRRLPPRRRRATGSRCWRRASRTPPTTAPASSSSPRPAAGRRPTSRQGPDAAAAAPMRTTLVLGLANEPGSLARALACWPPAAST